MAGEPVKIAELAKALEIDEKDAIRAVETLERHFEDEKRGITVKRYGDHLRLETRAEYAPYVERMDFILGVQAASPYNCGVLSLGDTLYINFIRNIREPELEYHFHCCLRDLGLPVTVESNRAQR